VALIAGSDLGGVEIGTQHAAGRAGLLDFGDHRRLRGRDPGADAADKVACRRLPFGGGT